MIRLDSFHIFAIVSKLTKIEFLSQLILPSLHPHDSAGHPVRHTSSLFVFTPRSFTRHTHVDMSDVEMKDNVADASTDGSNGSSENTDLEERYRSGLYLASAGYDGLVKLWSADDWQLLRTLTTDAGKVMSVDLSSDGKLLASGTYNRNFQLYAPEGDV